MAVVDLVSDELREKFERDRDFAIVGVLDSGIDTPALEPWVQSRETYDLASDLNPEHGAFVAGLIFAGQDLNPLDDCFGDDCAVLVDGQVMPAGGIGELQLLERISETVRKHPEVNVWNCSFAATTELEPMEYSVFASDLDDLAAELGLVFVQAAGNYESTPIRSWPPTEPLTDGIASPADASTRSWSARFPIAGDELPLGSPPVTLGVDPVSGARSNPTFFLEW